MSSRPLILYHGNCADGFTAAWAAWRKFGDGADYMPAVHQTAPPEVKGRDVIFVDFAYKPAVMHALCSEAKSILVLDHHKSAAEDMPHNPATAPDELCVWRMDRPGCKLPTWEHIQTNNAMDLLETGGRVVIYAYFDMDRSGAGLAWDFFHPDTPRPALVNHVEDRDLWRFALEGTREIQAAVFSYPYSFETWDMLAAADPQVLRTEGAAIERKHHKDVAELTTAFRQRMTIGGVEVWAANLPYTLTSDAGHLMCEGGEPFAACYWDTPAGRVYSLRSRDDGADVSAIAKSYGGGGHAHASGFMLPHGVSP